MQAAGKSGSVYPLRKGLGNFVIKQLVKLYFNQKITKAKSFLCVSLTTAYYSNLFTKPRCSPLNVKEFSTRCFLIVSAYKRKYVI